MGLSVFRGPPQHGGSCWIRLKTNNKGVPSKIDRSIRLFLASKVSFGGKETPKGRSNLKICLRFSLLGVLCKSQSKTHHFGPPILTPAAKQPIKTSPCRFVSNTFEPSFYMWRFFFPPSFRPQKGTPKTPRLRGDCKRRNMVAPGTGKLKKRSVNVPIIVGGAG